MQIAPSLQEIINIISTKVTTLIVAPTGSGKSVAVPAAVAQMGHRVFVVVPTRTAARSLAEYQAFLQKLVPTPSQVGYAAEGTINYDDNTRIIYVTAGHMRRKMLTYFVNGQPQPLTFSSVLIVDEFHLGSLDNTIIMSLWSLASRSGVTVPRIVVMSATPTSITLSPPPTIFNVPSNNNAVEIMYHNRDFNLDEGPDALYVETAKVAASWFPRIEGDMLIFAPGSGEVETIAGILSSSVKDALIIPIFSNMPADSIAKIYSPSKQRKIIVATNVAESAITIAGLAFVVDTMLEKVPETSMSGGLRLVVRYVSKDSATQRAGRTGRTQAGICYRMMTEQKYATLEQHRPPEVERVPLHNVVVELLGAGLNPEIVLPTGSLTRVNSSLQVLSQLGMIVKGPNGVTVTDSGHFAPKFPLAVHSSALLWEWLQGNYPSFVGLVVVCLIDSYGPSYFWLPHRNNDEEPKDYNRRMEEHKHYYFDRFRGESDLETCLNMWMSLFTFLGGVEGNPVKWCQENSMNNKKIKELLSVVRRCRTILTYVLGAEFPTGPFTVANVMAAVTPMLVKVYNSTIMHHHRDLQYVDRNGNMWRLDTRSTINTFLETIPPRIVAILTMEIKNVVTTRIVTFAVGLQGEVMSQQLKIAVDYSGYNPAVQFSVYSTPDGRSFYIARDDMLVTGTKQRALVEYLGNSSALSFAAPVANTGYAQVALGYAGREVKKNVHVFLTKTSKRSVLTNIAQGYGAIIHEVDGTLTNVYGAVENFVRNNKGVQELRLGLDQRDFEDLLTTNITAAATSASPALLNYNGGIWVAGGSGLISRVLARVFKKALINVVQVGKKVKLSKYPNDIRDRVLIHVSQLGFTQPATELPPVSSLGTYDAKVWKFIDTMGSNGDMFWNVAADITQPQVKFKKPPEAESQLVAEYTRYLTVKKMAQAVGNQLPNAYEALNALERWLVSLANNQVGYDPLFSEIKLTMAYPSTRKFLTELRDKKIPRDKERVNSCIRIGKEYLARTTYEPVGDVSVDGDTITIGAYARTLPQGRLQLLSQMGSLQDVAAMVLRYACLLPRGQQWNIPLFIYEGVVSRYAVVLEGFASPINSQIIQVNKGLNYCSLFPDVDRTFGSIGDFFTIKFDSGNVMCNPPFVESIMDHMANYVELSLRRVKSTGNQLRFFITVPAWEDAYFITILKRSSYKVYERLLNAREHFYVDSSDNDRKILASFNSYMFVLAVNTQDDYGDLDSILSSEMGEYNK